MGNDSLGPILYTKTRSSCYTDGMKNVTVTLEEDLLRRARIESASRGISLSAFVREAVSDAIVQSDHRGQAVTQAAIADLIAFAEKVGKTMDGPPLTRDEAHER